MPSFKEVRRKFIKMLLVFGILVLSPSLEVNALPNSPRLFGIIPPPQVLLPPHREEGQSLDDIIYGTSFSGGSLFPSLSTSTTTPKPISFFTTNRPFRPSPQIHSEVRSNQNLAKTFTPPSTTQATISTTLRPVSFSSHNSIFATSSRPSSLIPSSFSPSSSEEIKVPQTLKHRTPQRKQYTKADLIAAANSLKPAGFDFNKVLPTSPRIFNNSTDKNLYHNARFPLPLFDTPVFNELRPLMEMILKRQQEAKASGRGGENEPKIFIIPKPSASNTRTVTSPADKMTTFGNRQTKQFTPTPPPKPVSPTSFGNFQKTSKLLTTIKPKPVISTTKRISKLTEFGKKQEKSTDLQVAATSNKLSQQKNLGKNSSPSSSYSHKGTDKYSFSYQVKNDAYGDVKSHSESRDGDQVAGEYSMLEPDGYTRVVRYTVDSDQGFKASVKRIPPSSQIK